MCCPLVLTERVLLKWSGLWNHSYCKTAEIMQAEVSVSEEQKALEPNMFDIIG